MKDFTSPSHCHPNCLFQVADDFGIYHAKREDPDFPFDTLRSAGHKIKIDLSGSINHSRRKQTFTLDTRISGQRAKMIWNKGKSGDTNSFLHPSPYQQVQLIDKLPKVTDPQILKRSISCKCGCRNSPICSPPDFLNINAIGMPPKTNTRPKLANPTSTLCPYSRKNSTKSSRGSSQSLKALRKAVSNMISHPTSTVPSKHTLNASKRTVGGNPLS